MVCQTGPVARIPTARRRGQVFSETSTALIPLRPLTVGEAMDAAFLVLRRSPRLLLGLPILMALVFVFGGALLIALWWWLGELGAVAAQVMFAVLVVFLGGLLVGGTMMWMQGILTRETLHTILGERLSAPPRRGWSAQVKFLGPMIVIALMFAVYLSVASTVGQLVVLALAGGAMSVPPGMAQNVMVVVVWALGLFLSCWCYAFVSQTVPIYIAEGPLSTGWIGRPRRGTNLGGALGRSFSLVGWRDSLRIAGAIAATLALITVLASLLTAGLALAVMLFLSSMQLPVGIEVMALVAYGAMAVAWPTMFLAFVAYVSALQTIFYLDLRMRREGLDLALRFPQVPVPEPQGI